MSQVVIADNTVTTSDSLMTTAAVGDATVTTTTLDVTLADAERATELSDAIKLESTVGMLTTSAGSPKSVSSISSPSDEIAREVVSEQSNAMPMTIPLSRSREELDAVKVAMATTSSTSSDNLSPAAVAFSDVVDKIVKAPQQRLIASSTVTTAPSEKSTLGASSQNGTGVASTNSHDNEDPMDCEDDAEHLSLEARIAQIVARTTTPSAKHHRSSSSGHHHRSMPTKTPPRRHHHRTHVRTQPYSENDEQVMDDEELHSLLGV